MRSRAIPLGIKASLRTLASAWSLRLPTALTLAERVGPPLPWVFGLLLVLAGTLPAPGADDTNALGGSGVETNLPALRNEDTNSGPSSLTGTNRDAIISGEGSTRSRDAGTTNSTSKRSGRTDSTRSRMREGKPPATRESAPAAGLDLQSFAIISERNIFNPNRRGRSTRTQDEPEKQIRAETFSLVGTMSYEKGRFAFFDGSSSEYRKVIEPAGTIADYRVAEITPNQVKLESTNGQSIELKVGSQMKKEEEGPWTLSVRAEAGPLSAEEEGAALKRLMEKREKEGNAETPGAAAQSAPPEEKTERTDKVEKPEAAPDGPVDEALKKLMQKRQQELNK